MRNNPAVLAGPARPLICGVVSTDYLKLVCDREPGHTGQHRGYVEEHDDVLFWSSMPSKGTK